MNRRDASPTTTESDIRAVLNDWQQGVITGDLDRIFAHYAPDILSFDAVAQLQFKGTDAYRKHWAMCMEMCPGGMIFEIHELAIEADDNVAFCHYLVRCGGTTDSGEQKTSWMRVTAGYRKTGDKWLIVHEHFSSPFDMASGKALFDLTP